VGALFEHALGTPAARATPGSSGAASTSGAASMAASGNAAAGAETPMTCGGAAAVSKTSVDLGRTSGALPGLRTSTSVTIGRAPSKQVMTTPSQVFGSAIHGVGAGVGEGEGGEEAWFGFGGTPGALLPLAELAAVAARAAGVSSRCALAASSSGRAFKAWPSTRNRVVVGSAVRAISGAGCFWFIRSSRWMRMLAICVGHPRC